MKTTMRCWLLYGIAAVITLGGLAGCGSDGGSGNTNPVQIKILSNRADLVSGGDVYIEVVLPDVGRIGDFRIDVDGRDVTSVFAMRSDGRIKGVITGLANGNNVVTAAVPNASPVRITVTNHPIGGPVIAGTQIQPWVCATPVAVAESGNTAATNSSGLSTNAIDAQCNIATEFKYYYKTTTAGCTNSLPDPIPPAVPPTNGCFKAYNPAAATPADLATTTTDKGLVVPYIVRVERGTLNRGIYDIAVLFDPTKDWKPYAPQAGWNGKLVYTFGASTGQPRRQYRSEQSWTDDSALSRGFMVALNSMTDSLYNSNRVAMTETLMMMKEHIIDTYGEVRYTMGNGCSGGSINQNTAASLFPGLVDGIQPTCTYPDSETTGIEVSDCQLLVTYYNSPQWAALTTGLTQAQINAKKAAINGHVDQSACHAWVNLFANINRPGNYIPVGIRPEDQATGVTTSIGASRNNCQLPAAQVYDAVTNPTGYRCTGPDHAVAIWGTVPGTNRARDTRDNVGVQYGLKALVSGAITPEEFVSLNEKIGGADFDSNATAARSAADADALTIAYTSGIVSSGQQLAKTAILDVRGYDDSIIDPNKPPGSYVNINLFGIHQIWRSFSLRERLDKANGNHDNLVLWRVGTPLVAPASVTLQGFLTMDKWLGNLVADKSNTTLERKIVNAKPPEAFDFCYLSADTTFSTKITDAAVCNADKFLTSHSSPRQVAGGSLSENILKCQLKALDVADYNPAVLTAAQLARLQAVFPAGVCDWSKAGVNQQAAVAPRTFAAGPGGQPLGPAPVSQAF
jgi:Tannase-like family of unknown function (DUF6351)